jgi:Uri superfamily endonuclease
VWGGGPAGVYCLVLWLPRARSVAFSRRATGRFPRGWYVYTGSARRNLLPRLLRHLRRRKPRHWHIDHLRAVSSLRQIWVWPWTGGAECRMSTMIRHLPHATCPVEGFGASDCRCLAHLICFPSQPMPPDHGLPLTYRVRGGGLRAVGMAEESCRVTSPRAKTRLVKA